MAPFTAMESPMPLVAHSTDGELTVCKDAVDVLASIDQPLVVVAMVGKYRTGKSFLLNRLAGRKKGFAVASTVQSETKGIWMWCRPHPRKPDHCLVLLDTEGLGDVEKGDEGNDTKLFALAVLLSSMFVYNSRGTIDQQALQDINYVTELTQLIKTSSKTDEKGENFMAYFPGFVWTVRDFTLELEINGQQATPDQYLQNSLKLREGPSDKIKKFNLPRKCIRYYFPSRKCFLFDFPGYSNVLKRIETAEDSELQPDFVKTCNAFCEFIYTKAEKKTIPGCGTKMVTGAMFAHLLNTYVDVLSSGKLAFLDKVVQSLAETENEKAVEAAAQHYEELMKQQVKLPMETVKELNAIHEKCNKESFGIFLKRALGESEKHKDKLQDAIKRIFDDYCQRNEKESENKCNDLLKELFKEIDNKLNIKGYAKPGGYNEYITERNQAEKTYRLTAGKGVKAKEILTAFLELKMCDSECIRMMDQSLTDQERRMEADKDRRAVMELQKATMEQQMQMMKDIMACMAQSNAENMKQFMEMMRLEREANRGKEKRIEEAQRREMEQLRAENSKNGCVIC